MYKDAVVCSRHSLMVLLNQLYRSGLQDIFLFSPFHEKPVLKTSFGKDSTGDERTQVRILPKKNEYEKIVDRQRNGFLRKQIPPYNDLADMMVQAGICGYRNMPQLEKALLEHTRRDFLAGDRPVFVGLDTNLLRDRFYSARADSLRKLPAHRIGFSISPYVKDELDFDRKLKQRDLNDLSSAVVFSELASLTHELFNQNQMIDRKKRIGFVEIARIKKLHWIELLPELDADELESAQDLNIINSYKFASVQRNMDILLLSRDDGFIGHAQGIAGIFPFLLEGPKQKGREYACHGWDHLCQLLYLAAIAYGFVLLQSGENAVVVMGIWRGKRYQDWNDELVQVRPVYKAKRLWQACLPSWKALESIAWIPLAGKGPGG